MPAMFRVRCWVLRDKYIKHNTSSLLPLDSVLYYGVICAYLLPLLLPWEPPRGVLERFRSKWLLLAGEKGSVQVSWGWWHLSWTGKVGKALLSVTVSQPLLICSHQSRKAGTGSSNLGFSYLVGSYPNATRKAILHLHTQFLPHTPCMKEMTWPVSLLSEIARATARIIGSNSLGFGGHSQRPTILFMFSLICNINLWLPRQTRTRSNHVFRLGG